MASLFIPLIPVNFPYGQSITLLKEIINEHLSYLSNNSDNHDIEICKTRIEAAQNEISRKLSMQNAKTTKSLSRLTIALAVLTIMFAGLSTRFQYIDQQFDEKWLNNQKEYNTRMLKKMDSLIRIQTTIEITNKKIEPAN